MPARPVGRTGVRIVGMPGPKIRTDIVEVYVFRRGRDGRGGDAVFLQMRRAGQVPLSGTWQPVMGHLEGDETAAEGALRELREETGLGPGELVDAKADWAGVVGFWQLELPNTYFLHSHECIVMSPCFAVEIEQAAEPVLDSSHDAYRWVSRAWADRHFLWPGQRGAVHQIIRDIIEPGSAVAEVLGIREVGHD